jgi:flagellar motor switch/type III secretory pathway protein FliN
MEIKHQGPDEMGRRAGPPPALREMPGDELALGDLVAGALPFSGGVVDLPRLAEAARWRAATLRLERVRPGRLGSIPHGVSIALSSDGTRSLLVLTGELVARMVDGVLGRPPSAGGEALTTGEEGALLYALDRAGGDWLRAGGPGFTVRGILADRAQAAEYIMAERPVVVLGTLEHDGGGDRVLFAGPRPSGPVVATRRRPPWRRSARWPLAVRIAVGVSEIDAAEALALAAGDTLALDRWSHPLLPASRGAALVEVGGAPHEARWVDRQRLELVSCTFGREMMDDTRTDEIPLTLREPADARLSALKVTLRAVVGAATMPVEEALGLTPGRVLRLDQPAGTAVSLMAGDDVIAKGELVTFEGRLAVEITEAT